MFLSSGRSTGDPMKGPRLGWNAGFQSVSPAPWQGRSECRSHRLMTQAFGSCANLYLWASLIVETGHFPSWPLIEIRRPSKSSNQTFSTVPAFPSVTISSDCASPNAFMIADARSLTNGISVPENGWRSGSISVERCVSVTGLRKSSDSLVLMTRRRRSFRVSRRFDASR